MPDNSLKHQIYAVLTGNDNVEITFAEEKITLIRYIESAPVPPSELKALDEFCAIIPVFYRHYDAQKLVFRGADFMLEMQTALTCLKNNKEINTGKLYEALEEFMDALDDNVRGDLSEECIRFRESTIDMLQELGAPRFEDFSDLYPTNTELWGTLRERTLQTSQAFVDYADNFLANIESGKIVIEDTPNEQGLPHGSSFFGKGSVKPQSAHRKLEIAKNFIERTKESQIKLVNDNAEVLKRREEVAPRLKGVQVMIKLMGKYNETLTLEDQSKEDLQAQIARLQAALAAKEAIEADNAACQKASHPL